ncbi:hypothetical protein [Tenacibaculum jejuense]|uniref:Uncharacterized protein n=1 Tax=Tenacibaculum jejuense TaxID=584609 RepID=A0A238U8H0_9FLAO|nr:hypothetical protein [Tenacibaculum jejuense]SNR15457.1 conserved protein of unknown function [Tenacibaculum jejuense]
MSFKKKNILLLIGFVISLPLLYILSFSNTLELKEKYNNLKKEKQSADNISANLLGLKQEEKYIDSILKSENVLLNNSFQQILLKKINFYRELHAVEIVTFKNYTEVIDNGIKCQIYPITIRGDYNSLLQFLNYFEKEGLGEIKSYSFLRKKDYAKRKEYLNLEILFKRVLSE